jgi:hypothetical protein
LKNLSHKMKLANNHFVRESWIMEFWLASQLREEFDVIASFYQIEVGGEFLKCRNHAVIFRKGYANQKFPDAVVCMANPGSCCPSDSSYKLPVVEADFNKLPYISVEVDPTQWQLMRLMKVMNWNVISIVNLSDLCSGNMVDFGEKLNLVEQYSYKKHSIFDESRFREREAFLNRNFKNTKVILAWGQNSIIRKLASDLLNKFEKEEQCFFGLPYSTPNSGFEHPFPMLKDRCIKWLEKMSQHLNECDCS